MIQKSISKSFVPNDKSPFMIDNDSVYRLRLRQELSREEFNDLYLIQIKEYYSLSKTSTMVFVYFWEMAARLESDVARFILKECMEFTGHKSKTSIYNGLSELLAKNFIAKSTVYSEYYLNNQVFSTKKSIEIVKEYHWSRKQSRTIQAGENSTRIEDYFK